MLMARLNTLERWKYIRGTYDLINAIHRNRNKLGRRSMAVHLEEEAERKKKVEFTEKKYRGEIYF